MTKRKTTPRLSDAFGKGRPAFIGYLMAGYPDRARSIQAMEVLAEAGADVIELGVPYSDPLADGPVIRNAATAARRAAEDDFGLAEAIDVAGEFVHGSGERPPVVLMTYLNPLLRMGMRQAASAMRGAGVAGAIIPDLPPDMAGEWLSVAEGIDTVFLAAPTSTPERLAKVGELSAGFVYCVSTKGITGEREELPAELAGLIGRVKKASSLPVAVGFGVSTPAQAGSIAALSDGVIVGSALVRRQDALDELRGFARQMADAVHGKAV
jgi:tryptophan synthase alpha chain